MKKSNIFLVFILVIPILGVTIPKMFVHNVTKVSKKEIACASYAVTRRIFDNGIEPWLIMSLVVSDKAQVIVNSKPQEVIYTEAYTFFGLKYATVATICDPRTGLLVCAGRTYQIWPKVPSDPMLPCG